MGEYGTPNIDIEEGYIEIEHKGRKDTLPFPKLPGSLLPPVEGARLATTSTSPAASGASAPPTSTRASSTASRRAETKLDDRLVTRFDYDQAFGTALNRFCVQAMIGHPLTVYGKGGQTRGFLNIIDTLQCVELAAANPADSGEIRVFNQFTESFTVAELAEKVRHAAGELGVEVVVDHVDEPAGRAGGALLQPGAHQAARRWGSSRPCCRRR